MVFLNRKLRRRQFLSMSSMVLGAGMLMKPSGLLFAAGGPPGSVEPRSLKSDGTKYGKYIFSRQKNRRLPNAAQILLISGPIGFRDAI